MKLILTVIEIKLEKKIIQKHVDVSECRKTTYPQVIIILKMQKNKIQQEIKKVLVEFRGRTLKIAKAHEQGTETFRGH